MSTAGAAGTAGTAGAAAREFELILALDTVPSDRVSALWDSLEPARVDDIAGSRWKGTGLDTGHPMFGMLGQMRWWGKDFTEARKVDPILVTLSAVASRLSGIAVQPTVFPAALEAQWDQFRRLCDLP